MKFVSLFSGIEAASVALEPLGWECIAFAEVDAFPCRLLSERYPNVINLGDVTSVTELDVMMWGRVDVLIFGSPCQDLSVAGNRKGLAGERSGLFHDAMRIIRWARLHCELRFAWWENVPGAFTSNQGRDFAVVVGALAGCTVELPKDKAWGNEGAVVGEEAMVEWSTLDAQWFGVAQRRRRVFAIADFGDWASRPPILLEPESVRGDSAPRRGEGEEIAATLGTRVARGGQQYAERGLLHVAGTLDRQMWRGVNQQMAHSGLLVAFGGNNTTGPIDVATAVNAKGGSGRMDFESETLLLAFSCKDYGADATVNVAPTLRAMGHNGSHANAGGQLALVEPFGVRRFTPTECERLQGFPDGWTAIDKAADGPRYKALGNSMAVPVINWIGRAIETACSEFWQ